MIETIKIKGYVRDNIKIWGAKITGLDKKYGFKREFTSYKFLNDCSSRYAYFDYYIDVEENDIIEIAEKSFYKNKRSYYIFKNDKLHNINTEDIIKIFGGIICIG